MIRFAAAYWRRRGLAQELRIRVLAIGLAVFSFGEMVSGVRDAGQRVDLLVAALYAAAGLAGIGLASRPMNRTAAFAVMISCVALALATAISLASATIELTSLVRPSELIVIAVAASVLAANQQDRLERQTSIALRLVAAAMLLLFGTIHIQSADLISTMIPNWIPAKTVLPFVTGSAMIAAGLGILSSRFRRTAALVVAAMFASWIPLVHIGRLAANPSEAAEWSFTGMALALVGGLLVLAVSRTDVPNSIGEGAQP